MTPAEAFLTLVRQMSVGLVVWQFDRSLGSLRLVCSNPVASSLSGADLSGQVGRPIRELFPTITEARHAQYVAIACSPDVEGHLTRFQDARTEKTTFSIRALTLPEQCVGVIFQDLMDETSMLAARERRFRALLENSMDAIVVVDANGNQLYASQSVERILGYRPEDLTGTNGFLLVHPEDTPAARSAFENMLKRPGEPFLDQIRVRHRDGSWRLLEIVTVNRLDDPDVEAIVSNFRDITAEDKIQRELRDSEAQLRQMQKMEAIGRLAGGIAHDFNNLLTIVLSYSEMLLGEARADAVREELSEIKTAGERAAELTRQLLVFSRKQVLAPQIIDLNQVVNRVTRLVSTVLGETIQLHVMLGKDLWPTRLDPGQLEQALLNLVLNARDAMPEGGALTLQTANVVLDEEYASSHVGVVPGPHVMLSVADTGVGIDSAVQERMFEPFFTTKAAGKGTGLGLSVVLGIVQQSGGSIWVDSQPKLGTTFKLFFPRASADEVSYDSITPEEPEPRGGHETILLVEDESSVRTVAHSVLSKYGYTVLVAASGKEALRAATLYPDVDLLITDVVMPGMTGPQLAAALKKLRPELKVLYVSGYMDRRDADQEVFGQGVLEAGMNYLQKPLTPHMIARKVRSILDDRSATR